MSSFNVEHPDAVEERLRSFGQVDLVVAIPSFKEADTIPHVVRQCDEGLRRFFPSSQALIVNADNNSPDGTRESFLETEAQVPKAYLSTPDDVRGKGNNFYNAFRAAQTVDARAVVAVDADLQSITPEWMQQLAGPVVEDGWDYVTPQYSRNEYDGTITNHICFPLVYSLLGVKLRQPIGGDFGMSRALIDRLLEREWTPTVRHYGVDIFMTLNAVLGGFRICQTHLGAKIHKPSAPKLGPMLTQVVTTLFDEALAHRTAWSNGNGVREVPLVDDGAEVPPQPLAVDYKKLKRTAREDFANRRDELERFLSPETFAEVESLMQKGEMDVDTDRWSRILFELLDAYRRTEGNGAVVESLQPLFFARVASYFRHTMDLEYEACEETIHEQARHFLHTRPRYFNGGPTGNGTDPDGGPTGNGSGPEGDRPGSGTGSGS